MFVLISGKSPPAPAHAVKNRLLEVMFSDPTAAWMKPSRGTICHSRPILDSFIYILYCTVKKSEVGVKRKNARKNILNCSFNQFTKCKVSQLKKNQSINICPVHRDFARSSPGVWLTNDNKQVQIMIYFIDWNVLRSSVRGLKPMGCWSCVEEACFSWEKKSPKSHASSMETRPGGTTLQKHVTGGSENGRRWSGLMEKKQKKKPQLKYLAAAEDTLQLEKRTITSVWLVHSNSLLISTTTAKTTKTSPCWLLQGNLAELEIWKQTFGEYCEITSKVLK